MTTKTTFLSGGVPVEVSSRQKSGQDVLDEVYKHISKLRGVPSILELLIESFNFDNVELSEEDLLNIRIKSDIISETLNLVTSLVSETIGNIDNISTKIGGSEK